MTDKDVQMIANALRKCGWTIPAGVTDAKSLAVSIESQAAPPDESEESLGGIASDDEIAAVSMSTLGTDGDRLGKLPFRSRAERRCVAEQRALAKKYSDK